MTPAITSALLHDHGMPANLPRGPPRHHDHDIGPMTQAILHASGHRLPPGLPRSFLFREYVRQSSRQQVADHGESTRLQYGLTGRAAALGWPESRVMVIDQDLGRSAANAAGRPGFARLVVEIPSGDDLPLCSNTKSTQHRAPAEDQHGNNTDKTVLSGTRRHGC